MEDQELSESKRNDHVGVAANSETKWWQAVQTYPMRESTPAFNCWSAGTQANDEANKQVQKVMAMEIYTYCTRDNK